MMGDEDDGDKERREGVGGNWNGTNTQTGARFQKRSVKIYIYFANQHFKMLFSE